MALSATFKGWAEKHQALWEFVKFNVLSNISTLTRVACSAAGAAVFVNALRLTQPFHWLIFNYAEPGSNGLGGFLTFLVAEVLAQVVNFFVQMKWVFRSEASFGQTAWKYAALAALIVVVNLTLPGYVTSFCQGSLGTEATLASTVASVVNTLLAVVVSFPVLKFWIAPAR